MTGLISNLASLSVLGLVLVPPAHAQGGKELDAVIQNAMEQGHIPGLAAAIVKGDKVVWAKGYGMANIELRNPVSLDTPFFMASISKTVTATALMQLRDQGEFALQDDVNDSLHFKIVNPQTGISGLSYWHLLTHTAGLQDNWFVMDPLYLPGDSTWQLQDFHPEYWLRDGQFYDPMNNFYNWAPGSTYEYCNQGFSLLGLLGQNLSGRPFEDLCKKRIFEPLGMTNSSFRLKDFDPDEVAMPYGWWWNIMQWKPMGHYGYPDWPAGTLRSSILDMTRFQRAFINEGTTEGVQLLAAATVAEMLEVQVQAPDPQGLCFYYIEDEYFGQVVGHDGGDPGCLTDMYFRPADNTGVILLVNGFGDFNWYWKIYQHLWRESKNVSPAWHHLGHGLKGAQGQPYVQGTIDAPGGQYTLELEDSLPNTGAFLVIGLNEVNAPFHGGVLVPSPDEIVNGLTTDATGKITLTKLWPAGASSGTEVYFQFWVTDPVGPEGYSASNAIVATVP